MPLWKLMPERVVEHGEEARESQHKEHQFVWQDFIIYEKCVYEKIIVT